MDDGGTNRTLEIAKEYATRYPESIFPIHKENGGYGTTVNYSIEHATGKYFKLLDGDDWFDRNGLLQFLFMLRTAAADVVVTPVYRAEEGSDTLMEYPFHAISGGCPILISEMKVNQVFGHWNICFRTDVLRTSGVNLPSHMLYTDAFFNSVSFAKAKTIQSFNEAVYCYRIGWAGQSVSRETSIKHIGDLKTITLQLCRFCRNSRKLRMGMLNISGNVWRQIIIVLSARFCCLLSIGRHLRNSNNLIRKFRALIWRYISRRKDGNPRQACWYGYLLKPAIERSGY